MPVPRFPNRANRRAAWFDRHVEPAQREVIREAIRRNRDLARAAAELGVDPATLYRWRQRLGIARGCRTCGWDGPALTSGVCPACVIDRWLDGRRVYLLAAKTLSDGLNGAL